MQRFPAVSAVLGRWVFQEREEKQGLFHPSVFPADPLPAPGPHWGQVPLEKQKRFGDCWACKFRNQNKLCYRRFRAKLKTHRRWRQKQNTDAKYYTGYSLTTRGVFYGARMISAQLGTEFEIPEYDKIKRCIRSGSV